jgi:hypothetical protein
MWVRSKRDGGVQLFPDDWEYTAYHMASGLFEEIPDPTVSPPVPEVVAAVPASGAEESAERPASGPKPKPTPRKRVAAAGRKGGSA